MSATKKPTDIADFLPGRDVDFTDDMTDEEATANGGRLIVSGALRLLGWEDYQAYLKTGHWKNVRARTFKIHGKRCTVGVRCEGPLDVHHRTYVNLGDEKPEDTEVLCRLHHDMKHTADMARFRAECEMRFTEPEEE